MKKIFCLMGLLLILGCARKEQLYYAAPTALPNTTREMKTPGYWIGRHPDPDWMILSPEEIEKFNGHIQNELKLTRDLTRLPGPVRYGFITHFADERVEPTAATRYKIPGDIDFDELQNSGLDPGTPVAVKRTSRDGKWLEVESQLSCGWVRADRVVFCSFDEFQEFLYPLSFVVVTRAKADLFLNQSMTEFYDYVRMGGRLAINKRLNPDLLAVWIPFKNPDGTFVRRTAYVRAADVHEGYLPYTARTILRQAFELLNSPYGWGDMHGEPDCSRFIQEVYATVGIAMPRNSSDQGKVGRPVGQYDAKTPDAVKLNDLRRDGAGGVTVLQLKRQNHIVLFLGWVDGRPYGIHATWGYRQKSGWFETARVINRVAVTDLFLGEGGSNGSLIGRTVVIRNIR